MIKIIKEDQSELTIYDGVEYSAQNGKFIPIAGSGKTTLTRGMQAVPGSVGRGLLYKPADNTMAMIFSFGVTVTFADETAAELFRITFPGSMPTGQCGLVIDMGDSPMSFDNVSIQSLVVEQNGNRCTLSYTIRAILE